MATQAIQAMKLQMFFKPFLAQEALQRGRTHLRQILELEMITNQLSDPFCVLVRESQAVTDLQRHSGANFAVIVETNSVLDLKGLRLSNVVEQDS